MSWRTKGRGWLTWIAGEMAAWSMVAALVCAAPELVYRWRLEPQLEEVHRLRERLDEELRQLRVEEWEQWAGRGMERMRAKVSMAAALIEEKEWKAADGSHGPRRMVRLRPERTARPQGKSAPPVNAAPSAGSALPGTQASSADSAPSASRMPPVPRQENVLLRVSGVGPKDVVWTAIDGFYHSPYEFGGEDDLGVDCSALVQQVFGRLDVELPRTAQQQFDSRIGVYVGLEDVRPGDLLFFHTRPRPYISHVGIYAGDGEFLHAPRTGRRVEFQALNAFYRKRFVAGKRILGRADGSMASLPERRKEDAIR